MEKKNVISLLIVLVMSSCGYKKPFTIINKYPQADSNACRYYYIDANNNHTECFFDKLSKYNVGDTLK
jgi:hypothetical protein